MILQAITQDVHSGIHGGAVANPINALARIVAGMHDADGRITLPEFYDDVRAVSDSERAAWSQLPLDEAAYAAALGTTVLGGGEKNVPLLQRLWARPTLDCNGIVGGYIGAGSKTIIPASARVKITLRLVPDQQPEKVERSVRDYVARHTPAGMTARVADFHGTRGVVFNTDTPAMRAALRAYREGFGREPVFIRCGASVPVTELFQRLLGVEPVMMAFGLPADGLHGPNESFKLSHLYGGSVTAAAFIAELAGK